MQNYSCKIHTNLTFPPILLPLFFSFHSSFCRTTSLLGKKLQNLNGLPLHNHSYDLFASVQAWMKIDLIIIIEIDSQTTTDVGR